MALVVFVVMFVCVASDVGHVVRVLVLDEGQTSVCSCKCVGVVGRTIALCAKHVFHDLDTLVLRPPLARATPTHVLLVNRVVLVHALLLGV